MMTRQRNGKNKIKILLIITCGLILFYFLYVLYIFPIRSLYLLTFFPERPIFMIFPKLGYAILLIIGIIVFGNSKSWFLINLSSIGILSFWYYEFVYSFHDTILNLFFLELISIFMIILTNRKHLIQQYQINRSKAKIILIIIVPIVLTALNELVLYVYTDYSVIRLIQNK